MKIAGATVNQIPLDWENNTTNIISAIREACRQDVRILCLPELCITGYGCEDLFLSDWLPEKAWQELKRIAEECENITVALGLPVQIDNVTYNGACVVQNKNIRGITFKQNLARDGVHYEPRWFQAWPAGKVIQLQKHGDSFPAGDIIYDIENIKVGFEICEDAWCVNRPGHSLFQRKVNLILNPSASHFAMGKSQLRERDVVMSASGKFNCVYVFANLLGNEAGRMIYDGDILIAQSERLLIQNERLSFDRFKVRSCNIDFENPLNSEASPLTDNKDVKEELTKALTLGLFDYLRKSKAKGFAVSLSGGADSACCAVMVAEMVKRASQQLGWESFCNILHLDPTKVNGGWRSAVNLLLTCAYQGTQNSSATTLLAAKHLAESIGATFYHWTIDDEVNSYTKKIELAIGRQLTWEQDDIALQNIQARSRSPIIWMLANLKDAVLLTTSNRSEGDVGYATMDGDTSGSLAPIAGLSKPFILSWLRWAEETLGHTGLHGVNAQRPTAELRPPDQTQTDEADLMPYTVLAEIEKHAIRDRKPPLMVFNEMRPFHTDASLLKKYISKFFRLWSINQWKRERLAPAFHLDDLNVDPRTWCRFPILSGAFKEELEELNTMEDA